MAIKSSGTYLTFTPSGGTAARVGSVSSIGALKAERDMLEVTNLDSTAKTFISGVCDWGEVEITGFYSGTDGGQTALQGALTSGAAGTARITFPDGAYYTFSAFVKSFALGGAEVDAALPFTCVLRISGSAERTNP